MTPTNYLFAKTLCEHYASHLSMLRRKVDYLGPYDPQREGYLREMRAFEQRLEVMAGMELRVLEVEIESRRITQISHP